MNKRCEVLNLEWMGRPSRDRYPATLICNALRFRGYTVVEGSIFDGKYLVLRYKPKLVYLSCSVGGKTNHRINRWISDLGIPVVAGTSEGMFNNDEFNNISEGFWGWNQDKKLYESLRIVWTERVRGFVLKHFPSLKSSVVVGGSPNFDHYILSRLFGGWKDAMRPAQYGHRKFKKIIGVGCWDFGIFYTEDSRYQITSRRHQSGIERFKKDRVEFQTALEQTVDFFPDILFVLKEHPGSQLGRFASAIERLEQKKNVLIVKYEESAINVIAISDIWLVYDSTTALEAWLVGKPTLLLNPSGPDFYREPFLHKGSPVVETAEDLISAVKEYYLKGTIQRFDNLSNFRTSAIEETIQWDDGKNHWRSAEFIEKILTNSDKDVVVPKLNFAIIRGHWYFLLKNIYWFLIKHEWFFSRYKVNRFARKFYAIQKKFYEISNLS